MPQFSYIWQPPFVILYSANACLSAVSISRITSASCRAFVTNTQVTPIFYSSRAAPQ